MLAIFGLSLLLSLSGCGNESNPAPTKTETETDIELLALVSAAIESDQLSDDGAVRYSDFALARKQLDLPADATAYEGPLARLLVALPYASPPDNPPLETAIDGRSIQAAVSRSVVYGDPSLVALRTTQPFIEIATALRDDGYVQRGEALVSPAKSFEVTYPVVADAGDGVVVLGGSAKFVRDVLANRDSPLTPAAELIDSVPGPARVAFAPPSKCVIAGAAGQNLSPNDGELLLQVKGTASEEKLKLPDGPMPTLNGEIVFGDVAAKGDELRVEFTTTDTANLATEMLPIDGSTYEC